VSISAVVQQVGEVVARAHSLFGDPPTSGVPAAAGAGSNLASAGELVRSGQQQISGLSRQFATGYWITKNATEDWPVHSCFRGG
jgi:hypothetical protein